MMKNVRNNPAILCGLSLTCLKIWKYKHVIIFNLFTIVYSTDYLLYQFKDTYVDILKIHKYVH